MKNIFMNFPITNEEYADLDKQFKRLCYYQMNQLEEKNRRNNKLNDKEDTVQELQLAVIRAGSYYKRQIYIESCLEVLARFASDRFTKRIVGELQYLWDNRTRHGANRQKFGDYQEQIMDVLVKRVVPRDEIPDKKRSLLMDPKFLTYCKAITWNCLKTMGKKITREKAISAGQVSLSDYDYLITC